eukprot:Gb_27445 [translate_table: standard]
MGDSVPPSLSMKVSLLGSKKMAIGSMGSLSFMRVKIQVMFESAMKVHVVRIIQRVHGTMFTIAMCTMGCGVGEGRECSGAPGFNKKGYLLCGNGYGVGIEGQKEFSQALVVGGVMSMVKVDSSMRGKGRWGQ